MTSTSNVPVDEGWAWMIAFGVCMQNVIGLGILKSFGIILVEIIEEFDASSALGSSIISVQSISFGLSVPIVMYVLTTFLSNRQIMMCGSVIASLGIGLGFVATNIGFIVFSYGSLLGIGNACMYGPSLVMIGRYFDRRRGVVTALAISGGSIGMFIMPPVIRYLFDTYGLRGGLLLISGIAFHTAATSSLMRPVTYYDKRKPPNSTETPEREFVEALASTISITHIPDKLNEEKTKQTFCDTSLLRNLKFIFLLLASCFGTVGSIYIGMYIPPRAHEIGFSDHEIVWFITINGASDLVGRMACGVLADSGKVDKQNILIFSFLLNGLLGGIVPSLPQYWQLCVFSVVYGLMGGFYFSLIPLIVADFFGIHMLSKTLGILLLFEATTNGIAPIILGVLKDISGDYSASFYYMGMTSVLAAVFLFLTRFFHSSLKDKDNIVISVTNEQENKERLLEI